MSFRVVVVMILVTLLFARTDALVCGQWKACTFVRSELASSLMVKKVRRKRKEGDADEDLGRSGPNAVFDFDDLPDFDLEPDLPGSTLDESLLREASSSSATLKSQMGSVKPLSSLKDLLNDRSLEAQLNFDEPNDAEPLPSFADFSKTGGMKDEVVGNKKARQQERRAVAVAAEAEKESDGFFSNFPFFGKPDKETNDKDTQLSLITLLERGTWACIYILVAWELYLNSPFFERAAPMAPIVYDSLPNL